MTSVSKVFLAIVSICVFGGGGYYLLRVHQSSTDVVEAYMREQKSVPSTVCIFSRGGSFDSSIFDLTIYLNGQYLRADWIQHQYGRAASIHAISTDNGRHYYAWEGEEAEGIILPREFIEKGESLFFSGEEGSCRPWWMVDHSLFAVPDTVTFTEYDE